MSAALERLRAAGLRGERKCGDGFRFDCPVGHKSRGTLSVGVADDGETVLLHDFAGCAPTDVLASLGLSLGDLYPERLVPVTPEQRRTAQRAVREAQWRAAVSVLEREGALIEIAGWSVVRGEMLSAADHARLAMALQRVADARTALQ